MARSANNAETRKGDELYPGLVVHDGRVGGSITVGQSFSDENLAEFLGDLLNVRRGLARLLLVIADCERREAKNGRPYGGKRAKDRLLDALNEAFKYVEEDYLANTTCASLAKPERAKSGSRGVL